MVVVTRIIAPECFTVLERREPPPSKGPSSVRIHCTLSSLEYWSLGLASGYRSVLDRQHKYAMVSEQTFYVYDPSIFLRHEDTQGVVQDMLESMTMLRGLDLSPENWFSHHSLENVATSMQMCAQEHDDMGLIGGHYHFYAMMKLRVQLVFNEPKAVVRSCVQTIMQTVTAGEDQCSICLKGFFTSQGIDSDSSDAISTDTVNLPCSHPFHTRCITQWLSRGHTCPVCRHDLRGFVSKPWLSPRGRA